VRAFDEMMLESIAPPWWPKRMCANTSVATEVTTCADAGRCHRVTGQRVPGSSTRGASAVSPGLENSFVPVGNVCTLVKTAIGGKRDACHDAFTHSGRMKVKDVVPGDRSQSFTAFVIAATISASMNGGLPKKLPCIHTWLNASSLRV
jgi:hypothetical protein